MAVPGPVNTTFGPGRGRYISKARPLFAATVEPGVRVYFFITPGELSIVGGEFDLPGSVNRTPVPTQSFRSKFRICPVDGDLRGQTQLVISTAIPSVSGRTGCFFRSEYYFSRGRISLFRSKEKALFGPRNSSRGMIACLADFRRWKGNRPQHPSFSSPRKYRIFKSGLHLIPENASERRPAGRLIGERGTEC